jgi:topoisomerase IA-like protein
VPPYLETRKYVASIVRDFNRKKIAQQRATNSLTAKAQPQAKSKSQTAAKQPAPKTPRASASAAKRSTTTTGN